VSAPSSTPADTFLLRSAVSTTTHPPSKGNLPARKSDKMETEGLPVSGALNGESDLINETAAGPRQFCPERYRDAILELIEKHFCAHPLIPGYCPPNPTDIRKWAVRHMYHYCQDNDLQEVWAYLWENWYRPDRWPLWARSTFHQIPRLKTTMMVEAQ
jgi:hypothetical protein